MKGVYRLDGLMVKASTSSEGAEVSIPVGSPQRPIPLQLPCQAADDMGMGSVPELVGPVSVDFDKERWQI